MSAADGPRSRRTPPAGGKSRNAAGRTKSGKPRPGTGGQGRRKLEGKGPTPPAAQRPGHPAQKRASGSGSGSIPSLRRRLRVRFGLRLRTPSLY